MTLSRLNFMPPELKIVTYYHIDHRDLLALSHVSKFWRSFALADRRWAAWFELIVDPESGRSARDSLIRLQVLDLIPARRVAIVTLCFSKKCTICLKDTTDIVLPLLKRICAKCLHPENHAIMALSTVLTTYDLSEKEVQDVLVLNWQAADSEQNKGKGFLSRVKLVSVSAVKEIAIEKHGGEDNLASHLQKKKARFLKTYEQSLAEYNVANAE
ncbi:hypothetical protein DFH09DRAFT_1322866 [Mycena vulgaris]|nr:hypothetical protein DFH09DRAFT_1322866 [Mycena vulgaris]